VPPRYEPDGGNEGGGGGGGGGGNCDPSYGRQRLSMPERRDRRLRLLRRRRRRPELHAAGSVHPRRGRRCLPAGC
jgi:hypothetical protein